MGLVKVDVHKAEYQFERISFSDTECIKGLIKHRWMIDEYIGIEMNSNIFEASDVKPLNQELIVTYITLDDLLSKCELNVKQKFLIDRLFSGYSERDLADMLQQEVSTVDRALDVICKRVKNINDQSWKHDYIYLNYKRVEWNYKKCSRCGGYFPQTREFFSPDKRKKDGLYSNCKACN